MKNNSTSEQVQQQNGQQCSAVPLGDELPMRVGQGEEHHDKQESRISRLEKSAESTGRLMEFLTAILVAITFGGVAVSYFQWKTAQTQFHQDQRPYVISLAGPNFFVNQLIAMNFLNGNYGKSPAIESGGAGKVFFGDDAMQQADRWFKDEMPKVIGRRNRTILPPNTPASHIEARNTTVLSDNPVSGEQFAALLQKSYSIVAVMRQAYRDKAGNEYWTDTCVSNLAVAPNWVRVVECNSHNHVE